MTPTRPMTKSALAVAREALAIARAALPAYASPYSKKTFTQPQLAAVLVVRQFLGTDYRGMEQHLRDWSDLRAVLGLRDRVPDHSTLHKAAARLLEKKGPPPCSGRRSRPPAAGAWSPPGPGLRSTRPGTRPGPSAGTSRGGPAAGSASGGGRS